MNVDLLNASAEIPSIKLLPLSILYVNQKLPENLFDKNNRKMLQSAYGSQWAADHNMRVEDSQKYKAFLSVWICKYFQKRSEWRDYSVSNIGLDSLST